MNRRFFIRAGLTLAAAPMIVRADSIMRINPLCYPAETNFGPFQWSIESDDNDRVFINRYIFDNGVLKRYIRERIL